MPYSEIDDVKVILNISPDDLMHDLEIEGCIDSGDAIIDSELAKHSLSVPDPTPQLIANASAHFAAWLFRHRRAPAESAAFLEEANKFLESYVEVNAEVPFKVASA